MALLQRQQGFLVAQWQRIHLPMREMRVQSLGWEEPLEKEMATHSSIFAWEIPRTEDPGRLQSMGSQKSQIRLSDQNKIDVASPATSDEAKPNTGWDIFKKN